MNAEWKTKWLAALRSDEYTQGSRALKDGCGGYCCLEVLCDIRSKDPDDPKGKWGGPAASLFEYAGIPAKVLLPSPLREDLGIPDKLQQELTRMNDGVDKFGVTAPRKSFTEIADWIEVNL